MIELKTGTRIWIAAGFTDLRRGFQGLASLVETVLEQQPYSGHVFVFRGKRGDLIKLLWFDGDGLCIFQKRLERGRFIWPQATSGSVALTRAQLSMLFGRYRLAPAAENLATIVGRITHAFFIYNSGLLMAYFLRWPIPASLLPIGVLWTAWFWSH